MWGGELCEFLERSFTEMLGPTNFTTVGADNRPNVVAGFVVRSDSPLEHGEQGCGARGAGVLIESTEPVPSVFTETCFGRFDADPQVGQDQRGNGRLVTHGSNSVIVGRFTGEPNFE